MIVLAREIRGMTQQYLVSRAGMSLYALSRIERGVQADVSDQQAAAIARALGFPVEFLHQDETPVGAGASPCCSAGKAALDELDQKRVRGILSVLRINLRKLLSSVEIVPRRELPVLAGERPDGAARAAQTLRLHWNVPGGPIANLTALIESAGVIVVRCDFGMSAVGATSIRLGGEAPLILLDRNASGDQCRMMLAHQLGHLVLHPASCARMEAEADEFAHELLLPHDTMQSALAREAPIGLADLVELRAQWRVPIATVIERAHALHRLDANARNRLWRSAKLRPREQPLPHEDGATLRSMLDCYLRGRNLGTDDLSRLFKLAPRDMAAWYGASMPRADGPDAHGPWASTSVDAPGVAIRGPGVRRRRGVTADRV